MCFNTKYFYDYLYLSSLYMDYEASIDKCEESYIIMDDSSLFKANDFPKYCLKYLKQKINDLGIKYGEAGDCSPEFLLNIKELVSAKIVNLKDPKHQKMTKKL